MVFLAVFWSRASLRAGSAGTLGHPWAPSGQVVLVPTNTLGAGSAGTLEHPLGQVALVPTNTLWGR